jgi:hypothetical protein
MSEEEKLAICRDAAEVFLRWFCAEPKPLYRPLKEGGNLFAPSLIREDSDSDR